MGRGGGGGQFVPEYGVVGGRRERESGTGGADGEGDWRRCGWPLAVAMAVATVVAVGHGASGFLGHGRGGVV